MLSPPNICYPATHCCNPCPPALPPCPPAPHPDSHSQVTMASNYFGPLYLTLQLLDVLQASAPSRLVWVNSVGSQLVNPPYLGGNSWAPGGGRVMITAWGKRGVASLCGMQGGLIASPCGTQGGVSYCPQRVLSSTAGHQVGVDAASFLYFQLGRLFKRWMFLLAVVLTLEFLISLPWPGCHQTHAVVCCMPVQVWTGSSGLD